MNGMSITSERLQELRKARGYSQQDVAKLIGVGRTTYLKYESGDNRPTRKLNELARLFNVSADYLLGLTDTPADTAPAQPPAQKPDLNARDERDIQKKLQSILDDLDPDTGLAFYNGQEPMDNETRDLIRSSIENSLRTAKQLAKTKYTPKKYRNE